jgi:serine phosphatase RsbU (regulator of sigma subunit)
MKKTGYQHNWNWPNVSDYIKAAVACALGLLLVWVIDSSHFRYFGTGQTHRIPPHTYVPIHSVLEIASIVVSFAVFTIGWYGYRQTRNRQDLFIGVTYMAVGALDFVHTLSYKGMPNFLGQNSVGGAAAYWVTARLIGAVSLLAAAFITRHSKNKLLRPKPLIAAAALIVIGIVTLFTLYHDTVPSLMYTTTESGGRLTLLKVSLEYLVVALYAAAFWAFGLTGRWHADSTRQMRTALVVAIGSEVCFTLYRSAFDGYNLMGHLLKVGSYYFVLHALFVSSLRRPYLELSRTQEKLRQSFTRIGDALASGLRKDSTLKLISSLAQDMLTADFAAIGELTERDAVRISSFSGLHPEPFDVPLRDSITGKAIDANHPVIVHDLQKDPLARPDLLALGIRGFISAPIVHASGAMGAVYVGSHLPGWFTHEDAEILSAFARQAAVALQDADHYEKEHRIAEELQQVIFPPSSLEHDSFLITGRYQPAWEEASVGGDFYDYFDLGGGKIGVVIGDVSGKGLHAAVHTAIVKYSYQAYLREGYSPADALTRIDQVFKDRSRQDRFPDSVFVSIFCGVLDSETGRFVYASGGHEPAIKTSSQGKTLSLDSTGPILGLGIASKMEQREITVDPGDTLVMYTDGITESRIGGDIFGFDRLVAAVSGCAGCSPENMADIICSKALEHSEKHTFTDDIALVVIRRKA